MDRNTFIGLLLIASIMIGFSIWNAPSDDEIARQRAINDSLRQVQREQFEADRTKEIKASTIENTVDIKVQATADSLVQDADFVDENAKQLYGVFAAAAKKEARTFVVETDMLDLTFTTKGGRLLSASLKDYQTYGGNNLILFDSTSQFNLEFFSRENKNIFTDELVFETNVDNNIRLYGEEGKEINFQLKVAEGKYIEYVYRIVGDEYLLNFDVNLVGMNDIIDMRSGELFLNWMVNTPNQEKSIVKQREATSVHFKYKGESADDLGYSDGREDFEASLKWVSFKQQFFNTTLIANEYFDKSNGYAEAKTDEGSNKYVKELRTALTLPVSGKKIESFGMSFYFGPNKYNILKSLDIGLENIISLGWGIFGWVNKFAVIPVFNFLDGFGWSYGIIILVLTILLKLVLSPITYKTYMSGAKMRVLKPEITAINEKHKDDAMKKQQEMMSLYRQTGVNPLSGCIPMLIQMPILIAMFRFFPASIELRQESFLWAEDLSTYDSIYNFPEGFSIPFYGDHVSLFTLLMALSMVFYTRLNSLMSMGGAAEGPMAAQMKIMMYIMPIMMLFFFNNYSSGLSYYYFLANVISIGQTILIRKLFINEDKIRAKIEINKKRPKSKKKSGLQKRLEEMAKQKGIEPPKRK